MKEKIRQYAQSIGFDIIGFTDAGPLNVTNVLKDRERKGYLSGLEKGNTAERTNPSELLPGARSIISVGLYYGGRRQRKTGNGKITMAAKGRDYHVVITEMLNRLADFLKDNWGASSTVMTDNNQMVEREIARKAGVGFYGKNCSIINPDMGSFIFLGELITDLYIVPDSPLDLSCGYCDRCLKACPTAAITRPYEINAQSCLSYITVKKGFLPEEVKDRLQNRIYGCDTCQEACPYNKGRFKNNPALDMYMPFDPEDIGFILSMNNKQFKESFCKTSAGWRGKTVIQRNALIAAGNMHLKGQADAVAALLTDCRPVIRAEAARALSKILGAKSLGQLTEAYRSEEDEQAKAEIARYIEVIEVNHHIL